MSDEFVRAVLGLKKVSRQGWIKTAKIGSPESVADHSFCTAMLALLASGSMGIDAHRAVTMALLHDLAEHEIGDITPGEMGRREKIALEDAAMKRILQTLGEPLRSGLLGIWADFLEGSSPEAQAVLQIDKLELGLQAACYAQDGAADRDRLEGFISDARAGVTDPALCKILESALGG